MAQGPSDTILVAIRITLWIRESKVRNPDPLDRRRFVLCDCECILVTSGMRCRLAYGPADATATLSLAPVNPDWFLPSWFLPFWYLLTQVVPENSRRAVK